MAKRKRRAFTKEFKVPFAVVARTPGPGPGFALGDVAAVPVSQRAMGRVAALFAAEVDGTIALALIP